MRRLRRSATRLEELLLLLLEGVRREDARDCPFFEEEVRRAFAEAPFCVRRAALMGAVRYYVKASDTIRGGLTASSAILAPLPREGNPVAHPELEIVTPF